MELLGSGNSKRESVPLLASPFYTHPPIASSLQPHTLPPFVVALVNLPIFIVFSSLISSYLISTKTHPQGCSYLPSNPQFQSSLPTTWSQLSGKPRQMATSTTSTNSSRTLLMSISRLKVRGTQSLTLQLPFLTDVLALLLAIPLCSLASKKSGYWLLTYPPRPPTVQPALQTIRV